MNATATKTRTFTVKGSTFESTLTDIEARDACGRTQNNDFAKDLVRQCHQKGLTLLQWAWLHKLALEQIRRENVPVTPVPSPALPPVQQKVQAPAPKPSVSLLPIIAFLEPANRRLKSGASVTFANQVAGLESNNGARSGSVCVSRCRTGTWPGSYWVSDGGPYGANRLYGRITPQGQIVPHGQSGTPPAALVELLEKFAGAPKTFIYKYGVQTGRCCFCNLPLTDETSMKIGYGPVCAKNYDLPHGKKGLEKLIAAVRDENSGHLPSTAKPVAPLPPPQISVYLYRTDVVQASEIGLKPGEWPKELTWSGRTYTRTSIEIDGEGDVLEGVYHCREQKLVVHND